MKKLIYPISLLCLLFIAISCNCNHTEDEKCCEELKEMRTSEGMQRSKLKIRKFNNNENRDDYGNNLRVLKKYSRIVGKSILLRTPVTNKNFKNYGIYDISSAKNKAILYVITDGTDVPIGNSLGNLVLDHRFLKDDILDSLGGQSANFSIKKGEDLIVITFNQIEKDFKQANINELKEFVEKYSITPCSNTKSILICTDVKSFIKQLNFDMELPKEACGGIIID